MMKRKPVGAGREGLGWRPRTNPETIRPNEKLPLNPNKIRPYEKLPMEMWAMLDVKKKLNENNSFMTSKNM